MLKNYISYLQNNGITKNTIISYTNDLQHFFHDQNNESNNIITTADIQKWIHSMLNSTNKKPLAISTINRRINSLRSFYSWATEMKHLQHNPMQNIQDLKSADEDSEKIMWLTEKEFEDLLNILRKKTLKGAYSEEKYHRDRAIIYLLTYTGIRVEELSNMKLTDIDLDLKRIRIIGKGKKIRTIPISHTLFIEIKDWLHFRTEIAKKKPYIAESTYMFYSQRSPKFSVRGIQAMIESYNLTNKKLTPHMFRHTFCKWMLKATNNDIEKVRRLAGHSNISTTSKYLKDSYTDLIDAVNSLPKF